eukprot:COSAG02_NODE_6141_length_3773_cov_1.478498_4_plen_67_part_01
MARARARAGASGGVRRSAAKGRNFGLAVKWTETVCRCFNAYAVRPPVYSVIYNEKQTTSLTPVNPAF